MEKPCTCPPKLPVCVCGAVSKGKVVGRFVIPSAQEMESNPRSKSAKLRCFEKSLNYSVLRRGGGQNICNIAKGG